MAPSIVEENKTTTTLKTMESNEVTPAAPDAQVAFEDDWGAFGGAGEFGKQDA